MSQTDSVAVQQKKRAGKLRIGVIFGGRSGEHEVSLRSARSIIEALDASKYEVVPIAITKQGRWLAPTARRSANLLDTEAVFEDAGSASVAIIGDPSRRGLAHLDANPHADYERGAADHLDVVFPVLHGTFGEDGTIQGLLEMADVPYVGCGVLGSACGMDKVAMKSLLRDAGLPLCRYTWFLRRDWERNRMKITRRVANEIGFPSFIKPANLGSSVGISRATDKAEFEAAVDLAARYDRKIIVEEGLDVREIECAVLGNDEPVASLPGEYVVLHEQARFLDYTEKYSSTGHTEFVVPAKISKQMQTEVQKMAVAAFRAIDGAGLARVDFFLRRDGGELLLNELNTMPGFTPLSGYPKMWAASGLGFKDLVDRLVQLALERHDDKSRNQTDLTVN